MTFPTVETTANSNEPSDVTTHTVSLPSGITSGDLLICFFGLEEPDSNTITMPAGWNSIARGEYTGGADAGVEAFWKDATGSEGSSMSVDTSLSNRSAHVVYRISGAEDPSTQAPEGQGDGNANSQSDPPSVTPTGGAKDYLWIVATGRTHDGTSTLTAPTNYGNIVEYASGAGSAHVLCCTARRELNASSEDPGTFGNGNVLAEWGAVTVAVHPGGAATDYPITLSPGTLNFTGTATNVEWGHLLTAAAKTLSFSGTATNVEWGHIITLGSGSLTLAGTDVTLPRTYNLTVGASSFTLAGAATNVEHGRRLSAETGALTFAGAAVTLQHGYSLTVGAGTLSFTGAAINVEYGHRLNIELGTLSLTGTDLALTYRSLALAAGSFTLSGTAINIEYGHLLTASAGTLTFIGAATGLLVDRTLGLTPGTLSLSGAATGILVGKALALSATTFSLGGADVTLRHGYSLTIGAGVISFSGAVVNLDLSIVLLAAVLTFAGSDVTLTYTPVGGMLRVPILVRHSISRMMFDI